MSSWRVVGWMVLVALLSWPVSHSWAVDDAIREALAQSGPVTVAGWSPTGGTFGFWLVGGHTYLAKPGRRPKTAGRKIPNRRWLGLDLRKADTSQTETEDISLRTTCDENEEDLKCRWTIFARLKGSPEIVMERGESCMGMSAGAEPWLTVAPDGSAVALFSPGFCDHCEEDPPGNFELWLWALPDAVTRAYNVAGLRLHKAKDYAGAIKHYSAALKLDPKHALARYNRACAHALLGQTDEAIADLKPLLAKSKRKMIRRVRKDRDFDRIRDEPALRAVLK